MPINEGMRPVAPNGSGDLRCQLLALYVSDSGPLVPVGASQLRRLPHRVGTSYDSRLLHGRVGLAIVGALGGWVRHGQADEHPSSTQPVALPENTGIDISIVNPYPNPNSDTHTTSWTCFVPAQELARGAEAVVHAAAFLVELQHQAF